ncbi:MAG: zinc ribbon domain-containing protein [bacterium]
MPIYRYQCEACSQTTDVFAKMSDPPPATCPHCGQGPLVKTVARTAFHLKGAGMPRGMARPDRRDRHQHRRERRRQQRWRQHGWGIDGRGRVGGSSKAAPRPRIDGLFLALAAALAGCDEHLHPAGDTACGSGALEVALGIGNPYTAVPDGRFQVEAGLQGGFHFEVSVRVAGALDADHVDVDLALRDGEAVRARHVTADWLLHVDPSGPACE